MATSSDETPEGKRSPGLAVPLVIMTVLGAGAGLACGMFLLGAKTNTTVAAKQGKPAAKKSNKDTAKGDKKSTKSEKKKGKNAKASDKGGKDGKSKKVDGGEKDGKKKSVVTQRTVDIPPVIASIGKTKQVWIRMELKGLTGEPEIKDEPVLMLKISQDILSYLRTLQVRDVQSANGFYLLRTNLTEIARIRSKGVISEIAIQGLIVE